MMMWKMKWKLIEFIVVEETLTCYNSLITCWNFHNWANSKINVAEVIIDDENGKIYQKDKFASMEAV